MSSSNKKNDKASRNSNLFYDFFGIGDDETRNFKKSSSYGFQDGAECLVNHYYKTKCCLDITDKNAGKNRIGVPQKIHFVWLGPNSIPSIFLPSELSGDDCESPFMIDGWNNAMISWRQKHPDWTFKLWRESDIESLFEEVSVQSANDEDMNLFRDVQNLYERLLFIEKNYVMASDVVRWCILYMKGGVYIDIDYYCVGSLFLINQSFDWYCGASNVDKRLEINNGLLGSSPHHYLTSLILQHLVEKNSKPTFFSLGKIQHDFSSNISSFLDQESLKVIETTRREAKFSWILKQTGPIFLTRFLFEHFQNKYDACIDARVCILPFHYFHPVPNSMNFRANKWAKYSKESSFIAKLREEKRINEETCAVHLWACSWQNI